MIKKKFKKVTKWSLIKLSDNTQTAIIMIVWFMYFCFFAMIHNSLYIFWYPLLTFCAIGLLSDKIPKREAWYEEIKEKKERR